MVYDPIRDCDVPSPAASLQNPSPWADTTPGSERLGASTSYPPGFQDRRSPGVFRSSSGGIRNLMNEETGQDSRASSVHGSFSSAGPEDHQNPPRNRGINSLLNEGAIPISQSSSASSIGYTTHSHQSPGPKPYSLLDHDGFLAPTTPASGFARSSRSPYPANSPAQSMHNLPHEISTSNYRSPHPYGFESLPMRSPSVSVSPRHQLHNLPPPNLPSRPGSSSSAGGYPYSQHHYESPSHTYQQLSEHPQRPRSNSRMNDPPSRPRSSSRATDPPSRRTSSSIPASIPASYRPRHRSPSPPPRIPYAPHRITAPESVMIPISQREIDNLKLEGLANNPLRKKMNPAPPSWSGVTPSPSLQRSGGPQEGGNSYFPGESHGAGPSNSAPYYPGDNRGSGPSNSNYYPGDNGAGPSSTAQKRKVSGNDLARKGSQPQGSNGGPDYARRKVSEAKYTGNNGLVADHCKLPAPFHHLVCVS
jgi:mRNA (guanine-N7-)-methyltransferase